MWKEIEPLLWPLRQVHKGLTFTTNLVLLLFLYVVGVGPVSVLGKFFKTTFLPMKEKGASYWKEHKVTTQKEESYRRMF